MKREALNLFLSSENIDLHCAFLKNLRLKLSIIGKSYPELLNGDSICKNRRIFRKVPEEVLIETEELMNEIKLHELYFDSFTTKKERYINIRKNFSSEESLLYEIYALIKNEDHGYAIVYINEKRRIEFSLSYNKIIASSCNPLLVIDLYEHSYFYDYFYDKDIYYRKALEKLDFRKIEEALSSS